MTYPDRAVIKESVPNYGSSNRLRLKGDQVKHEGEAAGQMGKIGDGTLDLRVRHLGPVLMLDSGNIFLISKQQVNRASYSAVSTANPHRVLLLAYDLSSFSFSVFGADPLGPESPMFSVMALSTLSSLPINLQPTDTSS
jgi:hypothetical protein